MSTFAERAQYARRALDWLAGQIAATLDADTHERIARQLELDLGDDLTEDELRAALDQYVAEHRDRGIPPTIAELRGYCRLQVANRAQLDRATYMGHLDAARAALQ